jgi:hypothetical protein
MRRPGRRKLSIVISAACFAVTSAALVAGDANAKIRRFSGFACRNNESAAIIPSNGGGLVPGLHGAVWCPISDEAGFKKAEIRELRVSVQVASSEDSTHTWVCYSTWAVPGGACDWPGVAEAHQAGIHTLKPSVAFWSSASEADFGYFIIHHGGDPSGQVMGYTYVN